MIAPSLHTDRLILRGFRPDDVDPAIVALCSSRCAFVNPSQKRGDAWTTLATHAGHWSLRGFGMWAIEDKQSGQFAGYAGLYHPDHYDETELGWMVTAEAEGKGIALEAAMAARDYANEAWNKTGLVSYIETANSRSVALAESMGATLETTRDHGDGPFHIYRHPVSETVT